MQKQHLTVNVALFQTYIWIRYIRMPYLMISNGFKYLFRFFAMVFICIRCRISDCEKSLENVYESVCGSEISDFLGNQRTTPNSQNYTAANAKPFSSVTNGKYLGIFFYFDFNLDFSISFKREMCNQSEFCEVWCFIIIDCVDHDLIRTNPFVVFTVWVCVCSTDSTVALKWNSAAFKCSTSIRIYFWYCLVLIK